jgi:uncharacterized protein YecA (UPF0149 family)
MQQLADFRKKTYMLESMKDLKEGKRGINTPCPCGSGKKYKACHGKDAQ